MKNNLFEKVKVKKTLHVIFILLGLSPFFTNAQEYNDFDYHDPDQELVLPPLQPGETRFSENGLVHTPKGELKVLMIYAQFVGDLIDPENGNWGVDELPSYDEVFYTSPSQFSSSNTDKSLSNFYYQMSLHATTHLKSMGRLSRR